MHTLTDPYDHNKETNEYETRTIEIKTSFEIKS